MFIRDTRRMLMEYVAIKERGFNDPASKRAGEVWMIDTRRWIDKWYNAETYFRYLTTTVGDTLKLRYPLRRHIARCDKEGISDTLDRIQVSNLTDDDLLYLCIYNLRAAAELVLPHVRALDPNEDHPAERYTE